jgi:glycosyltransferase involved in cell wall biosynthesis
MAYVELGPQIADGIWLIRSIQIEPVRQGRLVPDHFLTIGNVNECVFVEDVGIESLATYVPHARALNRAGKAASRIVWGAGDYGYGGSFKHFNSSVVKTLRSLGVDVWTLTTSKVSDTGTEVPIQAPLVTMADHVKDAVSILNARTWPDATPLKRASLSYALLGYLQLEGSSMDRRYAERINKTFDAMLATSDATKQAMIDGGVTLPIQTFGHGIDPKMFPFIQRPKRDVPTFFHLADVQWRKGTDVLLKAFDLIGRDARLYIKATRQNPFCLDYQRAHPRITWDFKTYPPNEMADLFGKMDFGVFPHRGEGFGLPVIECEATGMPVITTKFAGPLDTRHPYRIWINPARFVSAQFDRGINAEPSLDDLIEKMRFWCDHRDLAARMGALASTFIHQNWTWEVKCKQLLQYLKATYGLQIPCATPV